MKTGALRPFSFSGGRQAEQVVKVVQALVV